MNLKYKKNYYQIMKNLLANVMKITKNLIVIMESKEALVNNMLGASKNEN